ncbi:MAG: metal ABC transporter ATP-binding protein [Candidatus Sungbacteria bacterium]|nr:metal ABC transporter ATP-binding protein [Candidatus Sungbacteria bacterium]
MDKNPILEVENLSVTIEKEEILSGLSFTVNEGDVTAIIGPNGAGKTVLFRTLLGTLPYQGVIRWRPDVRIGYVPQRFQIDKNIPITVREFFLLHEKNFLLSWVNHDKRIREALETVELPASVMNERLSTLSGGQVQRALIAWALFDKPSVLLFDEPTAGVDISGEETVYNLLHELQDKFGITIILVSHELNVVFRYATSVLCLNKSLVCSGEPHEVLTPQQLEKLYGETTFYHHLHTKEGEHVA